MKSLPTNIAHIAQAHIHRNTASYSAKSVVRTEGREHVATRSSYLSSDGTSASDATTSTFHHTPTAGFFGRASLTNSQPSDSTASAAYDKPAHKPTSKTEEEERNDIIEQKLHALYDLTSKVYSELKGTSKKLALQKQNGLFREIETKFGEDATITNLESLKAYECITGTYYTKLKQIIEKLQKDDLNKGSEELFNHLFHLADEENVFAQDDKPEVHNGEGANSSDHHADFDASTEDQSELAGQNLVNNDDF